MSDTTEIEKRNLEAHVELCAERYRFLEEKLETLEEKIEGTNDVVREVHDMVQNITRQRNDQLVGWGIAIIGGLLAVVGYIFIEFVIR